MKSKTVLWLLLAAAALLLTACGGDKEESGRLGERGPVDETTGVAAADFDWNIITKSLVTFYYQPDDSLAFKASALATRIDVVYLTIASALGWENPTQIEFYCYRNVETLTHYSSRQEHFYVGDKFFYGYGPNYGPMIAIYASDKLPFAPSKFQFLNEGLPQTLDFSGRNYHHATHNFLVDGSLSPVGEITNNTLFYELRESRRGVISASFIGYLFETYSPEKVQQLYRFESDDFGQAAETILETTISELQAGWLAYLPQHTNEMERIRDLESGR